MHALVSRCSIRTVDDVVLLLAGVPVNAGGSSILQSRDSKKNNAEIFFFIKYKFNHSCFMKYLMILKNYDNNYHYLIIIESTANWY